jgi:hypothetical protein
VSYLKIKIPSIKNLGRQRCGEEFNSGVKGLAPPGIFKDFNRRSQYEIPSKLAASLV